LPERLDGIFGRVRGVTAVPDYRPGVRIEEGMEQEATAIRYQLSGISSKIGKPEATAFGCSV
jgi:hypothetical protein